MSRSLVTGSDQPKGARAASDYPCETSHRGARQVRPMLLSLLGDRRSTLAPQARKATAVALAGEVDLDASAGTAPGAVITCVGLFGDVTLRVPPGTRVEQKGLTIGGDSEVQLVPTVDGPQLTLRVYGLLTDLEITDKPR